jgi:hypothetical protein
MIMSTAAEEDRYATMLPAAGRRRVLAIVLVVIPPILVPVVAGMIR